MKIHELQRQIVDNNLDKVFIMTGDEVKVMHIYLEKMYEVLNAKKRTCDTVSEAYSACVNGSFSTGRTVFVVYSDAQFLKEDKHWQNVFDVIRNSEHYLVLIYSNLDKRGKFYKKYTNEIILFEKLEQDILVKYVQRELVAITRLEALEIVLACDCQYMRILNECDKLKQLKTALERLEQPCTWKATIDYYKEENGLQRRIEDTTFDLANALLKRNRKEVEELSMQYKASGNSALLILSALYTVFRNAVSVLSLGNNTAEASKRTGLTQWQINKTRELLVNITLDKAITALRLIQKTEEDIKTGRIEEASALDYVIVNIMVL